jgi:glycerol-3-phosphate responsive antiterminator
MKIENIQTKLAKLWENLVIHYLQVNLIQGANEKTFKTQWLFF